MIPLVEMALGLSLSVFGVKCACAFDRRTSDFPVLKITSFALAGATGLWLVLSSLPLLLPVMMNTNVSVYRAEQGVLVLHVTSEQVQRCYQIDNTAYLVTRAGRIPAVVETADATSYSTVGYASSSSQTLGKKDFGLWKVSFDPALQVEAFEFEGLFDCGAKELVVSKQGPFPLFDFVSPSTPYKNRNQRRPSNSPGIPDSPPPLLPLPIIWASKDPPGVEKYS